MAKSSEHHDFLPSEARVALERFGANLALARKRRRESLRAWSGRLGVSVSTLSRLEKGDPGVGMGVYAAALWLVGRVQALPELADPALDQGALQISIRETLGRSRSRKGAAA